MKVNDCEVDSCEVPLIYVWFARNIWRMCVAKSHIMCLYLEDSSIKVKLYQQILFWHEILFCSFRICEAQFYIFRYNDLQRKIKIRIHSIIWKLKLRLIMVMSCWVCSCLCILFYHPNASQNRETKAQNQEIKSKCKNMPLSSHYQSKFSLSHNSTFTHIYIYIYQNSNFALYAKHRTSK